MSKKIIHILIFALLFHKEIFGQANLLQRTKLTDSTFEIYHTKTQITKVYKNDVMIEKYKESGFLIWRKTKLYYDSSEVVKEIQKEKWVHPERRPVIGCGHAASKYFNSRKPRPRGKWKYYDKEGKRIRLDKVTSLIADKYWEKNNANFYIKRSDTIVLKSVSWRRAMKGPKGKGFMRFNTRISKGENNFEFRHKLSNYYTTEDGLWKLMGDTIILTRYRENQVLKLHRITKRKMILIRIE